MSYTTIEFGRVCGGSDNTVILSYDSDLNRISVEGCLTKAIVAGDENYLTVIDPVFVDTISCENARFTMQGYAASNFASLGNTGTYINRSLNTTKSISFYKSYIRNRDLDLYYFGTSNYPVDCQAGSVRSLFVVNNVPDEPAVPTFSVTQTCNTTLNNHITITDPDDTDVWEYKIYRATSSTGTYSYIGSIDPSISHTYIDSDVSQKYWYKVQAYNPVFQTYSDDVETYTVTDTPENLSYNSLYDSFPSLGISATTDTYGCETEQKWYGKLSGGTYNYKGTGSTWTEYGLQPNTNYVYYSTYIVAGIETDPSEELTVNIPLILSNSPSLSGETNLITQNTELEWTDSNSYEDKYEIYRKVSGGTYSLLDTITDTTYIDTTVVANNVYIYKIRAKLEYYDDDIFSPYSNEIQLDTYPFIAPPTGVTISSITTTGATITWSNNNTDSVDGNYIEVYSGDTWNILDSVSTGTTSYDITGITPATNYDFRICVYNPITKNCSETVNFTTLDPTPFNLQVDAQYDHAVFTWEILDPPFGTGIRPEYRKQGQTTWQSETNIAHDATGYTITNLDLNSTYEVRFVRLGSEYPSEIITVNTFDYNTLFPYCDIDNKYTVTDATCGNTDGIIEITNKNYLLVYDFVLKDIDNNIFTFETDSTSDTFGKSEALNANWYTLTVTPKIEYKSQFGTDACDFMWIDVNNSDTNISISTSSSKPIQCGAFDTQKGRVLWKFSSTGSAHSLYIYKGTDLTYQDINFTGTTAVFRNATEGSFRGLLVNEDNGCIFLIPKFSVKTIAVSSISGIKNLFITPFTDDLDYNYWKTSDEDFYLESEDSSFFFSTKIKEYYSQSGGTLTWYKIPVKGTMSLSQSMSKVRQGILLEDTLNIDVPRTMIERFEEFTELLPNKWTYVIEDNMGQWWTGGYEVGATIEGYTQQINGEENKYMFNISAQSSDKLLTGLDKHWVRGVILENLPAPPIPTINISDCDNGKALVTIDSNYDKNSTIVYTLNGSIPTRSSSVYTSPFYSMCYSAFETGTIHAMQFEEYNTKNSTITMNSFSCPFLFHYWRFDEGSGSVVYDSQGDHNGNITNMYYDTGKNNTGLRPNNSDARINFGNTFGLEKDYDFSISFWIKRTGSVVSTYPFSTLITTTSKGWEVEIDSSGKLYFSMYADHTSNYKRISTDAIFTDYNWHFITICSDDKIYVDGVLDVGSVYDNLTSSISESGQELLLGNNSELNNAGQYVYDEVGFWNEPLSEDKVIELWNNGNGKFY